MIQATEPPPMTWRQGVIYLLAAPILLGLLLFLPAGRLDWTRGWLFLLVYLPSVFVAALVLWRVNPVIYRARSRIQPGTKRWDRILLAMLFPAFLAILPVAALDDGRFHWLPVPWQVVGAGYVLLVAGVALFTWAQAVNRFFEPGVRIQTERGHQVIDAGPYAVVRHPGYVAAFLMFAGMALSMGSVWALIPAAAAGALLVWRTVWEDQTLRAELPGYLDYARRVRWRLVPGIW